MRAALAGRELRFVHASDYDEGLGRSLAAGVAALAGSADAALICLADMPRVRPEDLDALIAAFQSSGGRAICVPTHAGQRGNPVLWPSRFFAELEALRGDVGARSLVDAHARDVRFVPVEGAGVTFDIDTPEELP